MLCILELKRKNVFFSRKEISNISSESIFKRIHKTVLQYLFKLKPHSESIKVKLKRSVSLFIFI